jgi:hypothetical protein
MAPVLAVPGQENVHPAGCFHANQLDLYVRGEVRQLYSREFLAYHNLAAYVKPNRMKNCLTEINADCV